MSASTEPAGLRCTPAELALIGRAADTAGEEPGVFVRRAALFRAREVLAGGRAVRLAPDELLALEAVLDRPAASPATALLAAVRPRG